MTKEELEKEAEEKFKVNNEDKDREHYYDRMWFKTGYLAGAEPREKRIEELEKVNAELKELLNCNNCSELSEEECEVCAEYSHFKCKRKEQLTKEDCTVRKLGLVSTKEIEKCNM